MTLIAVCSVFILVVSASTGLNYGPPKYFKTYSQKHKQPSPYDQHHYNPSMASPSGGMFDAMPGGAGQYDRHQKKQFGSGPYGGQDYFREQYPRDGHMPYEGKGKFEKYSSYKGHKSSGGFDKFGNQGSMGSKGMYNGIQGGQEQYYPSRSQGPYGGNGKFDRYGPYSGSGSSGRYGFFDGQGSMGGYGPFSGQGRYDGTSQYPYQDQYYSGGPSGNFHGDFGQGYNGYPSKRSPYMHGPEKKMSPRRRRLY